MSIESVNQLRKLLGLPSTHSKNAINDHNLARIAECCFLLTVKSTDPHTTIEDIHKLQRDIGKILAAAYTNGDDDLGLPHDPWKASLYVGQENPAKKGRQTEKIYSVFSWFNAIRLFIVRSMRLISRTEIRFIQSAATAIRPLTAIGSLSYGLEFPFDLAIVFKSTFFPSENTEPGSTRWNRFKNVLRKDERLHRMANAIVWFSVNLSCFFIPSNAAATLNTVLFMFDIFNVSWKAHRELSACRLLLNTLDRHICHLQPNNPERAKFTYLRQATVDKARLIRKKHTAQIAITTTVLAGMICIFFPPSLFTTLLGADRVLYLGAALTLVGSLFGGLGKKLYGYFSPSGSGGPDPALFTMPDENKNHSKKQPPTPVKKNLPDNPSDQQILKPKKPTSYCSLTGLTNLLFPAKTPLISAGSEYANAENQRGYTGRT